MAYKKSFYSYNPNLKERSRMLRKNSTLAEVLLWNLLKNRQIMGYKFRRQSPVDNCIVDFYCKELHLAIEIDGLSHDFKMEYDEKRQKQLEQAGITIFRISDREVKQNINHVIELLVEKVDEIRKYAV